MSDIQERLERDIRAVTGAVSVSENDLLSARDAIRERVESRRGLDSRRTVAVVAATAIVAAGVGYIAYSSAPQDGATVMPASQGEDIDADPVSGAQPTLENLKGFWRVDNGVTMVWFKPNGVIQISDRGSVISDPDIVGTYAVEDDTISVKAEYAPDCPGGNFSMRVDFPEPGLARVVLPGPEFGECGKANTMTLEHALPDNGRWADFTSSGLRGWRPVADQDVILGDWVAEAGGGYLLEIADDGTYYVADKSTEVVDNGRWRLRGSRLELFSRTESPQCEEGDFLVLGDIEYTNAETTLLRGTVDQNDCGGGWTPTSWILIPNANSE
jgi:hypothetical protein